MIRPRPAPPLTQSEQALLARWPDLNTQPRADWERCAAHLEEAERARQEGRPCSWCEPA